MIYGADLSNDTQGIIGSLNLTFRIINTVQVRVNFTPIIIIMNLIYSDNWVKRKSLAPFLFHL